MKIGGLDTSERVLVVAEIGNNHEGDVRLAEEMVVRAAEAGADAVKFQTLRAEHLIAFQDRERLERLRSFELSYDQFERLAAVAEREGVMFLSTPFDLESAAFLNALVPAFKIASGDLTFVPLLETVASFGKPVMLSCGMASVEEIRTAKKHIEGVWQNNGIRREVAVLHCVSLYPTPPNRANLARIKRLRAALRCTVGYSDHTLGIEAAVLAVALGARIVEKHFTLDKNHSDFRDHALSVDPPELSELVKRIRLAEALLGDGSLAPSAEELAQAETIRRSIATARDMDAGERVTEADLTWLRPGTGLPPGCEAAVIGKVLHTSLVKGQILTKNVFQDNHD